ncbi:hypothetical protein [Virgisporangium ochraceum]|uniref:Uncharacterized protein n=1 Tax=Virgisporangium ochraceum TaxID=65505 RepID=A0A8J4EEH8_9ACTN|nr:hypothetical protein [Virgisporangium ochraceum]GIJ72580.1 hypothetical protein Voc01_074970 [Virgisporangium ochraceum]
MTWCTGPNPRPGGPAAGPAHADVAWRAAARAAGHARALHGYEEAAALLAAARAAQAHDRACGPADRYDLLMAHAEACRWAGDRDGQLDAIDLACRAADELGDVERLARAAVAVGDGSVWTLRDPYVVHPPAVDGLRRVLRELPTGDSDLRCRSLLTLAGDLHYADAPLEREALTDEGLAMARRIGDPHLRAWAAPTTLPPSPRRGSCPWWPRGSPTSAKAGASRRPAPRRRARGPGSFACRRADRRAGSGSRTGGR